MKTCSKCGRTNISDSDMYCPNCGSKELVDGMVSFAAGSSNPKAIEPAPLGKRFVGALIDFLIFYVLLAVDLVPFLNFLITWFAVGFILFRDAAGGVSVGKGIAGLKVVDLSGRPISAKQSILRNIIFAVPVFIGLIPEGIIVGGCVDTVLVIIECLVLVVAQRRIGDRIAGTTVVVKA